jgi:D-xylose transport system substrate-binding protein
VSKPQVFEVDGGVDIDPNATEFALGYNASIWGKASVPLTAGVTNGAGYTLVGEEYIPGWDYSKVNSLFGQSFAAHPQINATLEANDGLANAVIQVLKAKGVPAKKIPTIGQDATLQGMGNILEGYQCGTVYKPTYMDTQAAIALATFLRAGQTPPAALLTAQVTDPSGSGLTQPAVLAIGGIWVDGKNMASTVLKDGSVSAADLCKAVGAQVCSSAGITP